ncbi:GMC oxidoreductase [Ruegeria arenilitoris]|uniref:GMC oxidoreductase n=1 Tax=Ruegeria arenilitoris TaxID=1173585 RepID=UPI001CFED672|nr:GMC oxidoreductase [Ruegeria arenilitoris]
MTDLVIGSGPSGVSVAMALLNRGRQVLMLDPGGRLEAPAQDRRDKLAASDPDTWSVDDQKKWQAPQFDTPPGQVRRFGSDFAMVPGAKTLVSPDQIGLRASHATGGLSNLWGSAVLPNRAEDIADWPISIEDLSPHYQAVAQFLPISGRQDALQALFPALSMQDRVPLTPSPQAQQMLQLLEHQKSGLSELGAHAGLARLAVEPDCRYCGQCLHGCPWGYIYSARKTFDDLRHHSAFQYHTGLARRFQEHADHVAVTLDNGETLQATRVFVAAGVLETARLLLTSSPDPTTRLQLQDSQHFFLPSLHRWRTPRRPDQRPYHTLPQIFIELDGPEISPHLVHAQVYTWNEFYAHDLINSYGSKLPGSAPLWRLLARRLIVAQAFLHSAHSARIDLTLAVDGRLASTVHANDETENVMGQATSRLAQVMKLAGLIPLTFARRPGDVGSSFHVGGSVPMAKTPSSRQSDILGRPKGLSRVHLVDASSLPSITATTITFSVMANAHRIGSLAP